LLTYDAMPFATASSGQTGVRNAIERGRLFTRGYDY
jgi:hypothetical protein